MRIVRHGHLRRNLRFRLLRRVDDVRLVLDERPFKASLRPKDVKALAILAGRVIEEPPDVSDNVGALDLDVTRFDGILVSRLLGDVLAHRAAAKTTYILGWLVHQAQARADD